MSWTVEINEEELKAAEENSGSFGPLEEGWYEVFITGVDPEIISGEKKTPGLEIVLTVRDDVEQPGKRKKVWETLWVSPKAMVRFQKLLKAVGRESGTASKEEMVHLLKGKSLQVEVIQETYQKKDRTEGIKNKISFLGFKPSAVGGVAPVSDDPFANNGGPIDISDDDLPF